MTTATVTGARPRDWAPLTENGRDPIPGDWEEVKATMESLRATARMIKRCRDLLTTVEEDSESWKGESGTAFREHTTGLGDRVHKAHGRYEVAAEALDDYWPVLRDAQEESLELRKAAIEAQEEAAEYAAKAEAAEDPDSDFHDRHDEFTGTAEEARGRIASLRGRLADLIRERDAAANDAAEAIRDFIGKDDVRNRFWDGKWEAIQDVLGEVGAWAGTIGAIAGILSLFLGWIPIVGQVLGVIALIGTLISLVGNLANGNWVDALIDVIGIATLGIGKAAGVVVKATGASAKARAFGVMRRLNGGSGKIPGSANRASRTKKAQDVLGDTQSNLRRKAVDAREATSLSSLRKEFLSGIKSEVTDVWRNPAPWRPVNPFRVSGESPGLLGVVQGAKGNFDAVADLATLQKAKSGVSGVPTAANSTANAAQVVVEFGGGLSVAGVTLDRSDKFPIL
ncbi:putative T7SS-secreted protein [Streptomyces alkaliphilus]|uniref:putative T7SS-secreted protein n=1 Tax=Streptomyces alkaliphilus TaxID=1472722 RepID=UPI0011814E80|nr:hypothetical protein [Streptomyces alkaliphilus]MQS06805.1 hypothetical protein [Streptomyces alkaliphilus]